MIREYAGHIFEKFPNMKFHENPLCGEGGGGPSSCGLIDTPTGGRTDRHDEANSRVS